MCAFYTNNSGSGSKEEEPPVLRSKTVAPQDDKSEGEVVNFLARG